MSTEASTLARQPAWLAGLGPGLALTALLAALSTAAAELPLLRNAGLSALTLAILLGMAVGNTVFQRLEPSCGNGVEFAKSRLLRLGIILYGFRITFQQVAAIGWSGLLIDLGIVAGTMLLAMAVGQRLLRLDRNACILIGAGSAICGAAAVVATDSVVRARPHQASVAVATVVVFGTLAMFLYPWLYPWLPLSETAFGIYAGSTIHEVAQVLVAGNAVGPEAAAAAVVTQMLRVMLLAPFRLLLGSGLAERANGAANGSRLAVPCFAVLFMAAAGLHSTGLLPPQAVDAVIRLDNLLLAMAMAALGLGTQVGAIRQAGLKPILLAGTLFAFLTVGGYGINRLVMLVL